MTPLPRRFTKASTFSLIFFLVTLPLWAQELTYDQYTTALRPQKNPSTTKNIATHFLVYPFELVRWPIDQTLVYVEQHHIDKKVQWIYDEMGDQGITPRLSIVSVGNLGGGAEVDFVRLLRQKENFPDMTVQGWVQWNKDVNFEVGSKLGWERIADTGFRLKGLFKYENRPEEHFYGIGPDTSAGEGTSYRMEATTLEPVLGYDWNPSHGIDFKFGYRNINITNGEDGGRGIIDPIFAPRTIPGLGGDELITLGIEYRWDTRNRHENSTRGGHRRIGFSYNEGVGGSDARYFKYEAEASQFFSLGSERRVLALHLYGEHNNQAENHYVPFHQMAKLGGYGAYPRLSQTLRGFDSNRFFDDSAALLNLEYRYRIWEYRDFKVDSVLFWDEGQVFQKFSRFQFQDFRESYGLGFRLSLANHVIFALELAHGDEGTQYYVKSSAPF